MNRSAEQAVTIENNQHASSLMEQQQRFLEALERLGTIKAGIEAAGRGVNRRTVKKWLETDAAFRERFEEAKTTFKESIEERLIQRLDKGNGATLRFVAKGELPEKYGDSRRRPATEAKDEDGWAEAERALDDDGGAAR